MGKDRKVVFQRYCLVHLSLKNSRSDGNFNFNIIVNLKKNLKRASGKLKRKFQFTVTWILNSTFFL